MSLASGALLGLSSGLAPGPLPALVLVGSKVLVALLAARSRDWLAGRLYRRVMRVLASLLACFALLLFREGLRYLAVI